jgi:glycosyltransferase involved in cell wall biosynthesis
MKISYAITVCNELEEIKRLVPIILENKQIDDEIVILYDQKNGDEAVLDYLLPMNIKPHVQTWRGLDFDNNFADWKNKLDEYCTGDFVFQLDADEYITKELVINLPEIISRNPQTDLFVFPRINTVEGITGPHLTKWGWNINDKGWVNFPDRQGRLYRKGLKWEGKVHERVVGAKYYSLVPEDELLCIHHPKTIERQERQNNLYSKLMNNG